MTILFLLSILTIVLYSCFMLYVSFNFKKSLIDKKRFSEKITVIIPCRNEELNIGICLNAILRQSMQKQQFEVIVVDDFSEDDTLKVAGQFMDTLPLRVLKNKVPGKKNALSLGIENSLNEIIITTDADCTMSAEWLNTMLSEFMQGQLNMLCGPVNFNDTDSLFEQLQRTESAAIIGISAVMLNAGRPATCNGANLMFSKQIFNQLEGYKSHLLLATGDDDLLMQEFYRLNPSKVRYALNKNAMVYTEASPDFDSFLHQRIRWLAKRKHYIYPWNSYIQMLVFFQLLAFYILLVYFIFTFSFLAILSIVLKYISEIVFGIRLQSVFRFRLIYIFRIPFFESYIFRLLFLSQSIRAKWKGRAV